MNEKWHYYPPRRPCLVLRDDAGPVDEVVEADGEVGATPRDGKAPLLLRNDSLFRRESRHRCLGVEVVAFRVVVGPRRRSDAAERNSAPGPHHPG